MSDHARTRGGAVLLQRLGPLRMGEQSRWSRAPQSRGLWAFPWPLFEMFFAYHQYGYPAPRRLRTEAGLPTHHTAWIDKEGATAPPGLSPDEMRELGYRIRDGFGDERHAWVETVGHRVVRRHQFWFSGDVYTHLTQRGQILGLDQWRVMSAMEYAAAIRRSGADLVTYRSGEQVLRRPGVADHLEVFIAPGTGPLLGRSPLRRRSRGADPSQRVRRATGR